MIPSIDETMATRVGVRCWRTAFLGATLTLYFVGTAAAEDSAAAGPLQVAFHIDLLGDELRDAATSRDETLASPQAMEFTFAGLPVKLGMRDDKDAAGMGLEAGLEGDYELALGERLTLVTSATLAKAGYVDNAWGSDRAVATTTLRYQHDGLILALEPSWHLRMVEAVVTQRDYGTEARFAKSIFPGFDLSGGVSYGRHDDWNPGDDYDSASAHATLSYRFAGRMKIDLSYATTYKLPDASQAGSLGLDNLRTAENTAGPTVTMTFPLWDALDIAATYRYCRSVDDVPRRGGDRRVDDKQSFDMSAAWHPDDAEFGGLNFTAAYAYDRLATNADNADEQSHAATIALAIPF